MKKNKLFTIIICTVLAFSTAGCSNSSGNPAADDTNGSGSGNSGNTNDGNNGGGAGGSGETGGTGGTGGAQNGSGGTNGGSYGTSTITLPYTILPVGTNGSAGVSDNETITYVEFGTWPQTKYTGDTSLINTETTLVNGWTVHTGPENMYYIEEDGNYYKVEPIKWRILTDNYDHDLNSSTPGKKLLLAENVLTAMEYYDDSHRRPEVIEGSNYTNYIYPNNYMHSKIRAYLNGYSYKQYTSYSSAAVNSNFLNNGFINKAFTTTELAAIANDTLVDNSADSTTDSGNHHEKSTDYVCGNTNDKIFLLSLFEVTNYDYLFDFHSTQDEKRKRVVTDYAHDKGELHIFQSGAYWWLRSPRAGRIGRYLEEGDGCSVKTVSCTGTANNSNVVNDSRFQGVVPALCLK